MSKAQGIAQSANQGQFKNRIINGAMMIDQRNAGASVTVTLSNQFGTDRWQGVTSVASKFSLQQNAGSVTPPVGFTNYLGATSLAATTVSSSDYYFVVQNIEGLNVADLGWGTSNASPVTISFWVRSSLTGTFGGSLRNSAANRSYPFNYTVSSANTWEQKTVTIAGDTTGTWLTNNGIGISLAFSLGSGSTFSSTAGAWTAGNFVSATGATSVVGTNGATFYITGVQLEKGSTATSFDYRPYGTELALCQRYYHKITSSSAPVAVAAGVSNNTASSYLVLWLKQTMRVAPTVSYSNLDITNNITYDQPITGLTISAANENNLRFTASTTSVQTQYQPTMLITRSGTTGFIDFSSEL